MDAPRLTDGKGGESAKKGSIQQTGGSRPSDRQLTFADARDGAKRSGATAAVDGTRIGTECITGRAWSVGRFSPVSFRWIPSLKQPSSNRTSVWMPRKMAAWRPVSENENHRKRIDRVRSTSREERCLNAAHLWGECSLNGEVDIDTRERVTSMCLETCAGDGHADTLFLELALSYWQLPSWEGKWCCLMFLIYTLCLKMEKITRALPFWGID